MPAAFFVKGCGLSEFVRGEKIPRIYLSGKITGNESYREDFAEGRARLENAGYGVCDPTGFGFPEDISWEDAMRHDIREMLGCDGVALLPSWEESRGARIEARLARELGMVTMPISRWLGKCPIS